MIIYADTAREALAEARRFASVYTDLVCSNIGEGVYLVAAH